MSEFIERLFKS